MDILNNKKSFDTIQNDIEYILSLKMINHNKDEVDTLQKKCIDFLSYFKLQNEYNNIDINDIEIIKYPVNEMSSYELNNIFDSEEFDLSNENLKSINLKELNKYIENITSELLAKENLLTVAFGFSNYIWQQNFNINKNSGYEYIIYSQMIYDYILKNNEIFKIKFPQGALCKIVEYWNNGIYFIGYSNYTNKYVFYVLT